MIKQTAPWTIEFFTRERGDSPVKDFVDDLPTKDRAQVDKYLRLLRELGTKLGPPHTKPIRGHSPLWELRPPGIRLYYFAHTGRRFVVLEAHRKKRPRATQQHIIRAEQRMAECLERERDEYPQHSL
jgi:phage-related protein